MSNIQYQNPNIANVTAVLDSEKLGTDAASNQDLLRQVVVSAESASSQGPFSIIIDLLSQQVAQLRRIRLLLEQDVVPDLIDDTPDEMCSASGIEDGVIEDGLEDL